jgi:hypothetical protein
MVETISPVVYGSRARWLGSLALHAAGAAATAAAFGAAVAVAGSVLGAPWGRAGAMAVVAIAVLYAGRDLLGLPIPVPQLRRQVPDWWRTFFGRPLAAFLYGAGLGVGFLTYLGHGTLVVVAVGIAATGRPMVGALAMAPFGLARGIAPLVAARAREPEDSRRLVDRLSGMDDRGRSLVNAAALVTVGAVAGAGAWSTRGGWGRAAAAALAVAFGWAALSKVTGMRRWRRTLEGHHLPGRLVVPAACAIPLIEAQVPLLVVSGRERAAAALALAALAIFSAALVRAALRDGRWVPCGCFGRSVIDVRTALVRNALLAGVAAFAWGSAAADPSLVLPSGADVVPATLAAVTLAAAAATAWRASVWFSRGRA